MTESTHSAPSTAPPGAVATGLLTPATHGGWQALIWVLTGAIGALLLTDSVLNRMAPTDHHLLQTEDGVAELRRMNPSTLVLGSSYARSLVEVRRQIEASGGPSNDIAVVPDEGGQFIPYRWVLQERLRPLMEETVAGGGLKRDRLNRVMLVTSYYDLCKLWEGAPNALPAHGWAFSDFLRDAWEHGITDFNRNYLRARWNRLWPRSALVQDRGVGRIQGKIRWMLPGREARAEAARQNFTSELLKRYDDCFDPGQRQALEDVLTYLNGRGLEVVMLLFPQDPWIITPEAEATTLKRYSDHLAALQQHYRFRVVDLSTAHPLVPSDFMEDMDHLNAAGERHFASWALQGPLAFMLPGATDSVTALP